MARRTRSSSVGEDVPQPRIPALRPQDWQILYLVVDGASQQDIAHDLGVSESSVARSTARVKKAIRTAMVSGEAEHPRPRAVPETTVLQARVDADFARELLDRDAKVLGLTSASDVVREALKLLHRSARERAAADAYDEFFAGATAPLPAGVAPADAD